MITIGFANIKGGCGKTSDTAMVAASLVRHGYRVLVIDGDPQGGLTEAAGLIPVNKKHDASGVSYELMDVLDGKVGIKDALIHSEFGDILPNTFDYFIADKKYTGPASYSLLKNALKNVSRSYDYCLIDCLPGAGYALYSALNCCNYVIIPILAAKSSVRGISLLSSCIDEVKSSKYLNPNLKILGFVVNRFNKQTKFGMKILEEIRQYVKPYVNADLFDTKIRNAVAIDEAQYIGISVFKHKAESNVARDFENLTEEILSRINEQV